MGEDALCDPVSLITCSRSLVSQPWSEKSDHVCQRLGFSYALTTVVEEEDLAPALRELKIEQRKHH